MSLPPQPTVTVLVPARDVQDSIVATLESALAQDHPAELLHVLVVDDGSTDATAELVAERAALDPSRIRLLRQARTGAATATSRALAEAEGDLLALLEPGDVWPTSRISSLLAALREQPQAGLAYADAAPVPCDPPSPRPVGRLLREECLAPSSIALRADVAEQLGPVPAEIGRPAWWLTVRAACVADVVWAPEHGAAEAAPPARRDPQTLRDALALRRWFLRRASADAPYLDEVGAIWRAFTATAQQLHAAAQGDPFFTDLVTVTDADRAEARATLAEAHDALVHGEARHGLALAVRAAALDPWCTGARTLLAQTLAARPHRIASDPLAAARRFVTLAFADELLAHPELLSAYGRAFDGGLDATLAIDASTLVPAEAHRLLGGLVADLGLDRDGAAHLVAVTGPIDATVRRGLPLTADALLTHAHDERVPKPAFDERSIDALRTLAAHAWAA